MRWFAIADWKESMLQSKYFYKDRKCETTRVILVTSLFLHPCSHFEIEKKKKNLCCLSNALSFCLPDVDEVSTLDFRIKLPCVCVCVQTHFISLHFTICVSVLILDSRQKKAEELRRLTDKSASMSEEQLTELRAEIKVNLWNGAKCRGCAAVSSEVALSVHYRAHKVTIIWVSIDKWSLLPRSTLWASENMTRTSGRPCDSPLTSSRWRRASQALDQVRSLRHELWFTFAFVRFHVFAVLNFSDIFLRGQFFSLWLFVKKNIPSSPPLIHNVPF